MAAEEKAGAGPPPFFPYRACGYAFSKGYRKDQLSPRDWFDHFSLGLHPLSTLKRYAPNTGRNANENEVTCGNRALCESLKALGLLPARRTVQVVENEALVVLSSSSPSSSSGNAYWG